MTTAREHKEMYLGTIRELESKIAIADHYSLIRVSGLLRGMLIDDHPLIDRVNRDVRLKLSFEILDYVSLPDTTAELRYCTLDPTNDPWKARKLVRRDNLLSTTCLTVRGKDFSVGDVIRVCANVKGGVHFGSPTPQYEEILYADSLARIGGLQVSTRILEGLARVLLAGLEPLTNVIREELEC